MRPQRNLCTEEHDVSLIADTKIKRNLNGEKEFHFTHPCMLLISTFFPQLMSLMNDRCSSSMGWYTAS